MVGKYEEGHRRVRQYVSKLLTCKSRTSKSRWLTTRNPSSYFKWEHINIDFTVGLPQTQNQYNTIWVVLDRLTKSARFILVNSSYLAKDYASIFIDDIVCRYGISLSNILNRGAQFTSRFWRLFQKRVGY